MYLILFSIFLLILSTVAFPTDTFAHHDPNHRTVKLLGIDLGCYADLPPADSQGCGLDDFMILLRRVINYFTILVIPLAAAIFVWGGLVIMTAAGSMERISKGKQIIWTAIIGVAITLGAWLIINSIYLALTGKGV